MHRGIFSTPCTQRGRGVVWWGGGGVVGPLFLCTSAEWASLALFSLFLRLSEYLIW